MKFDTSLYALSKWEHAMMLNYFNLFSSVLCTSQNMFQPEQQLKMNSTDPTNETPNEFYHALLKQWLKCWVLNIFCWATISKVKDQSPTMTGAHWQKQAIPKISMMSPIVYQRTTGWRNKEFVCLTLGTLK